MRLGKKPIHAHEQNMQRGPQNIGRSIQPRVEFALELAEGFANAEWIALRHGQPGLCFRGKEKGKIEELARRRRTVVEKLLRE